tara:strand:+ start:7178 stop:7534 length:357 start_codon:yes stop_codon:yes gene_type:complete
MSEIFNAQEEISLFCKTRREYQKFRALGDTFYSEKYDFLFSLEFIKDTPIALSNANYSYTLIQNSNQFKELIEELSPYTKNTDMDIFKDFSKVTLPIYVKLITRTLVNDITTSQIRYS